MRADSEGNLKELKNKSWSKASIKRLAINCKDTQYMVVSEIGSSRHEERM